MAREPVKPDTRLIESRQLVLFAGRALERMGLPPEDREVVASALVDADLRGLGTHGVVRLPQYAALLRKGVINPRPRLRVIGESPAHALLDNDFGFGFLGSVKAMGLCVEKAKRHGTATAAVRNSTHFGAAGYYSRMAAEQGLIGFAASNAYPVMAPPGALTPTHGNNPFSFAFPAGGRPPVVVDMATSVVSQGRIRQYGNEGRTLPEGWAYDPQGRPARDPAAFALLAPFGDGGAKGFALAVALDILSGVLSGSLFARQITSGPGSRGCGHFFLALDPGRFMPLAEFGERMEEMIAQTQGARRVSGEAGPVFLPGERGAAKMEQGLGEGVPLPESTVNLLDGLAEELGLEPVARAGPGRQGR